MFTENRKIIKLLDEINLEVKSHKPSAELVENMVMQVYYLAGIEAIEEIIVKKEQRGL